MKTIASILLSLVFTSFLAAHDIHEEGHSHQPTPEQLSYIEQLNTRPHLIFPEPTQLVQAGGIPASSRYAHLHQMMQKSFGAFDHKVKTRSDGNYFYVESDGIPEHQMMVGIRAWQQQVPLPKDYTGNNAWRIPLKPVPARNKLSARNNFFRGAIALAVNGVPIFNPIKNDGRTDTFLAGELDKWGGHCGRGDDYHYHLPPVHLQSQVGTGMPIAFALDGYPIFGLTEPDGSPVKGLDSLNGHQDAAGNYHYHSTRNYPYLNGGFHGEVRVAGGQVDPQPRAEGVRPATRTLRGAVITGFEGDLNKGYSLTYALNGKKAQVRFKADANGGATFQYVDSNGTSRTENYQARGNRGGNRPPPRREQEGGRPKSDDRRRRAGGPPNGDERQPWIAAHFTELDTNRDQIVSSEEMKNEALRAFGGYDRDSNGFLTPAEYEGRSQVRSAMGGFIKEHASEFDENRDRQISTGEMEAFAMRMFSKSDLDRNGEVTIAEASARGPRGGKRDERRRP